MNLNTYNKPAFACLATRIPYGTKITKELLKKIEKNEEKYPIEKSEGKSTKYTELLTF